MINTVLFDYDDTLVQTKEAKFLALKAVAERYYGKTLSDQDLWRHWGIAYEKLFERLFGDVEPDIQRAIERYESLDDEYPVEAYPEMCSTLATLAERIPIGIVTAAGRNVVVPQLRRVEFDLGALVLLQTAEDTSVHKPDSAVFDPALQQLAKRGILPAHVLYVGDSLRDLQAARAAGLQFRGVLRGTTSEEEFVAAGGQCIKSLTELLHERCLATNSANPTTNSANSTTKSRGAASGSSEL